jgi:hypothetical protein
MVHEFMPGLPRMGRLTLNILLSFAQFMLMTSLSSRSMEALPNVIIQVSGSQRTHMRHEDWRLLGDFLAQYPAVSRGVSQ